MVDDDDAIARAVHVAVEEVLDRFAADAEDGRLNAAITSGGLAAICLFMWDNRKPGRDARASVVAVTEAAVSYFRQCEEQDAAGFLNPN